MRTPGDCLLLLDTPKPEPYTIAGANRLPAVCLPVSETVTEEVGVLSAAISRFPSRGSRLAISGGTLGRGLMEVFWQALPGKLGTLVTI